MPNKKKVVKMNLQDFHQYVKDQQKAKSSTSTERRGGGSSRSGGLRGRLRDQNDDRKIDTRNSHTRPGATQGSGSGFKSSKSGFRSRTSARIVKDAAPAPDVQDDTLFPSLCVTEDGEAALPATSVSLGAWSNGIQSIIDAKDAEPELRKPTRTRRRRYSDDYSDYTDNDYSGHESDYEDAPKEDQAKDKDEVDSDADWEDL